MPYKFYNQSQEQLNLITKQIGENLKRGDVLALHGDLGSGKTTFSSLLIKNLLKNIQEVTSPTFNLVHVYPYEKGDIWHFDLYRLKKHEEIYALGIEDAFNYGTSIIEWPEIISNILPKSTISIELTFSKNENLRNITIKNFQYALKYNEFILNSYND